MLETTVGDREFREANRAYLEKYQFSNAETQDFWNLMIEHSHQMDITRFMDSWTRQMGFPVVSLVTDLENKKLRFKQKRFLPDPDTEYDPASSPYR